MEKNKYQAPRVGVVKLQACHILAGSEVKTVSGDSGIGYGGGSTVGARSNENGDFWEDED